MNPFERFGIKQVANVQFEALATDAKTGVTKGDIVLFLDTLKVSTIEITGETADARGGWGNPSLISWDYNKEINLNLEDALFSMSSLVLVTGAAVKTAAADPDTVTVRRTKEIADAAALTAASLPTAYNWVGQDVAGVSRGNASVAPVAGNYPIRVFYDEEQTGAANKAAYEITINADSFPGTYKIIGDTMVRPLDGGKDQPFQFVIPKAKLNSDVTFSMEAEGDPAVFTMGLKVLRSDDGSMIKLIKYEM